MISGEKKNALNDWVAGVGGFAEKVDKFIIITGKVSEYRDDEQFQLRNKCEYFCRLSFYYITNGRNRGLYYSEADFAVQKMEETAKRI